MFSSSINQRCKFGFVGCKSKDANRHRHLYKHHRYKLPPNDLSQARQLYQNGSYVCVCGEEITEKESASHDKKCSGAQEVVKVRKDDEYDHLNCSRKRVRQQLEVAYGNNNITPKRMRTEPKMSEVLWDPIPTSSDSDTHLLTSSDSDTPLCQTLNKQKAKVKEPVSNRTLPGQLRSSEDNTDISDNEEQQWPAKGVAKVNTDKIQPKVSEESSISTRFVANRFVMTCLEAIAWVADVPYIDIMDGKEEDMARVAKMISTTNEWMRQQDSDWTCDFISKLPEYDSWCQLDWRPGMRTNLSAHLLRVYAAMLQSGRRSQHPTKKGVQCNRCTSGNGVFESCVKLVQTESSFAIGETTEIKLGGACACCIFTGQPENCSFHTAYKSTDMSNADHFPARELKSIIAEAFPSYWARVSQHQQRQKLERIQNRISAAAFEVSAAKSKA